MQSNLTGKVTKKDMKEHTLGKDLSNVNSVDSVFQQSLHYKGMRIHTPRRGNINVTTAQRNFQMLITKKFMKESIQMKDPTNVSFV